MRLKLADDWMNSRAPTRLKLTNDWMDSRAPPRPDSTDFDLDMERDVDGDVEEDPTPEMLHRSRSFIITLPSEHHPVLELPWIWNGSYVCVKELFQEQDAEKFYQARGWQREKTHTSGIMHI